MITFHFRSDTFATTRILVLLAGSLWASHGLAQSGTRVNSSAAEARPNQVKGMAVVELFTSQGCNSCPPADVSLRQIASVAAKNGLPVHVLSFHVDYWDRLGWKDPYSNASNTNRQRAYASVLESRQVYTPQIIVNGRTEFVGSDKAKAHTAITSSLAIPVQSTVSISAKTGSAKDSVDVRYSVAGAIDGMLLNAALVENPKSNKVTRGENAGQVLSHVNVVRAFDSVALAQSSGVIQLRIPDGFDTSSASVIAYVQSPKTLAVSGAASAVVSIDTLR